MRNFKFIISYDGSRYFGWERQPGRDTIQGKLEAVLTRMCGTDVQVSARAAQTQASTQRPWRPTPIWTRRKRRRRSAIT